MKIPFIIYVDAESLLEKIDTCNSHPKKSSTTGYSLLTYCLFDTTRNKNDIIEVRVA